MKRRIALSIALAVSVLILLASLPAATAQGQQRQRFRADLGVVTPGAGQILRVTVAGDILDAGPGQDRVTVRFRRMQYAAEACNSDGVCRHTVAAQSVTAPVTLSADQAAFIDIPGDGSGVRVVVESNGRARVVSKFIDAATGGTVSKHFEGWTDGIVWQ